VKGLIESAVVSTESILLFTETNHEYCTHRIYIMVRRLSFSHLYTRDAKGPEIAFHSISDFLYYFLSIRKINIPVPSRMEFQ
jgi:hypothetical protein